MGPSHITSLRTHTDRRPLLHYLQTTYRNLLPYSLLVPTLGHHTGTGLAIRKNLELKSPSFTEFLLVGLSGVDTFPRKGEFL